MSWGADRLRLIDLGGCEPLKAQTFYEAVAVAVDRGLSQDTLVLCRPSSPYVCIGYHQDLEQEVDVDFCKKAGLPIIRRGQGGGAVYLDENQVFYQYVLRKKSRLASGSVEDFFRRLLSVTVRVYRELGLNAEYKPINDVVVDGKKISGNGAGELGSVRILVGNVILDIDYDMMARVLRVPDEKFRDKMAKSMREWVTSLSRELGFKPPYGRIKELIVRACEQELGVKVVEDRPSKEELRIWEAEIKPKHLSEDWLYMHTYRLRVARAVKIADGVKVVEVSHKARKLIRVRAELMADRILDIALMGDFFMIPEEAVSRLEKALRGVKLDREEILRRVSKFYEEGVETPGIGPEDFVEAVLKLKNFAEKYPEHVKPYVEEGEVGSNS